MRFPPEFIDRVQEANNLVDIISQYTQLKQSGNGYMGRCPFPDHAEKTASFSVSQAKQVYHCFGCKKSGNIFTFLRDYNALSFPDAVEYLSERASIPLPLPGPMQSGHYLEGEGASGKTTKKQMLKLNRLAADFFVSQLNQAVLRNEPVQKYVSKRKLKPETLEEFQIGYARDDWEGFVSHLHQQTSSDFSLAFAEEAKLIKARKEEGGYFDLFRDRLIFPILSPAAEVLGFGGRILELGEPKYLNSPETLVFNKGRVLYGLAQTGRYIRSEDSVVVVEGYMDLISLFQAGLKNVAATMGTALTPDHARLIKRLTTNVVVLFDGDEAGQRAAERSLPLLLAAGLYPRGLVLTEAKDPDEYIHRFGLDSLKKKLASAPDLFTIVLQMWMKEFKGEASQKVQLIDQVRPVLSSIPDERLRSLYVAELAQRMNVAAPWVNSALRNAPPRPPAPFSASPAQPPESVTYNKIATPEPAIPAPPPPQFILTGAERAELILLQLSLKSRANFEVLISQQILSQINHLGVRALLEKATEVYRQDLDKFDRLTSLLIDYVDRPDLLFFDSSLNPNEFDGEKENKMILDCIRRIQQMHIKRQVRNIALGLKQNVDTEKLKEIDEFHRSRLKIDRNK